MEDLMTVMTDNPWMVGAGILILFVAVTFGLQWLIERHDARHYPYALPTPPPQRQQRPSLRLVT